MVENTSYNNCIIIFSYGNYFPDKCRLLGEAENNSKYILLYFTQQYNFEV